MSLGILTNVAATYAENNLNQTQGSLQTVLQQLSSGSRINSGADDAAGLSVADGLHANVAALTQSAQNAADARHEFAADRRTNQPAMSCNEPFGLCPGA